MLALYIEKAHTLLTETNQGAAKMDLVGYTLLVEAVTMLTIAIKTKSNFSCYLAVLFASISLPFLFIGA